MDEVIHADNVIFMNHGRIVRGVSARITERRIFNSQWDSYI
jgi:hypothetical protein